MRVGAIFPHAEIEPGPAAIRAFAEGAEGLGLDHILAYDHVVGADPAHHPGWSGPYTHENLFHEPMVLFGFLSGVCSLELTTGILILPQRQAVLVAKQAAEVDVLSQGRLRLGVGLGWNRVEYDALAEDFTTRGHRIEEQVEVLRALWSAPVIHFDGREHRVAGAGIAPLPIQRPIPIWFAGRDPRALRRAGRLGDGFMPVERPGPALDAELAIVHDAAVAAGRDPAAIGLEGRLRYRLDDEEGVAQDVVEWRRRDATHLSIETTGAGLVSVDEHLAALRAALAICRCVVVDQRSRES